MKGERTVTRKYMRPAKIRQTAFMFARKNPTADRFAIYHTYVVPYAGAFDHWQTGWRAGVMAARDDQANRA